MIRPPRPTFRHSSDCARLRAIRLVIALLIAVLAPIAAQTTPPPPQVLIIYDGRADLEVRTPAYQIKGYIHALFIQNLLGHFGLTGEVISFDKYQPGQLQHYRAGFFVGVATAADLPDALVSDIRAYQGPFCWLGQHIEELVNTPQGKRQYGFTWLGYNRNLGVNRVVYKDTPLQKVEPDLSIVKVTDPKSVEVVATAYTKQNASYPWVLHRNRFWYFADSPFAYPEEGGYYLAFCDLMHDILGIDHKPDKRALVRIEDVSIDQDPVDLKRVSDMLAGYGIPFQIALIPIFRNPAKELEVRISDRRSFADSLHYMVAHGGTPVMHGVTHQYRGQSGDDYEFWDDTGDRAIAGDSAEFVQRGFSSAWLSASARAFSRSLSKSRTMPLRKPITTRCCACSRCSTTAPSPRRVSTRNSIFRIPSPTFGAAT